MKNLLDLLPIESLRDKPVGIVAMGASHHHFLGADWHLRNVLSWFGALTAPTSVYLSSADFAEGVPTPAAAGTLDELVQTLIALRDATRGLTLGPAPLAASHS
jgi:FMN reductase